MPQGDRTGPNGEGPRTGLGQGDCSEEKVSEKDKANKRTRDKPNHHGMDRWRDLP